MCVCVCACVCVCVTGGDGKIDCKLVNSILYLARLFCLPCKCIVQISEILLAPFAAVLLVTGGHAHIQCWYNPKAVGMTSSRKSIIL